MWLAGQEDIGNRGDVLAGRTNNGQYIAPTFMLVRSNDRAMLSPTETSRRFAKLRMRDSSMDRGLAITPSDLTQGAITSHDLSIPIGCLRFLCERFDLAPNAVTLETGADDESSSICS